MGGDFLSKKYKFTVIRHIFHKEEDAYKGNSIHFLSIRTSDYRSFVDEVLQSECVISASLHGIIIAESYGVPAIFLNDNMNHELVKYYDWYFSTGRYNVKMAFSLEEAFEMTPMELPDLSLMRKQLISCFPYDLFKS